MVPVQFEKLVAGVEAYSETLPVINAVRECLIDEGIGKLPVELVEIIERFVVEPERERRLVVWSKLKRCWDDKCILKEDHPIPAEQDWCPCYDCSSEECRSKSHPANLNGHVCLAQRGICYLNWFGRDPVCRRDRIWRDIHEQNIDKFEDELGSHGRLYEQESLLKRKLNIGFWVTKTCFNVDERAALAYLTLPDSVWRSEAWEDNYSESGFGIPVHLSAAPSPEFLKKTFDKALKKLGLEISVHRSQEHAEALSVTKDEKKVSEGVKEVSKVMEESGGSGKVPKKAETWPQLTLLMHSDPRSED